MSLCLALQSAQHAGLRRAVLGLNAHDRQLVHVSCHSATRPSQSCQSHTGLATEICIQELGSQLRLITGRRQLVGMLGSFDFAAVQKSQ